MSALSLQAADSLGPNGPLPGAGDAGARRLGCRRLPAFYDLNSKEVEALGRQQAMNLKYK